MVRAKNRRGGLTLAELLVAATIMLMIAAAVGTLASAVKSTNDYCNGYTTARTARVALSRIEHAVANAYANEQFPGCLVVAEQAGSSTLPNTLVVWYPDHRQCYEHDRLAADQRDRRVRLRSGVSKSLDRGPLAQRKHNRADDERHVGLENSHRPSEIDRHADEIGADRPARGLRRSPATTVLRCRHPTCGAKFASAD